MFALLGMLAFALIVLVALLLLVDRFLAAPPSRPWSPRGQRAIVTGATAGMGRCLAVDFAKSGARALVLVARREAELDAVKAECERAGAEVRCVVGSVGEERVCREAVETCVALGGGVDTIVCNAGLSHSGFFEDLRDEDLSQCTNITDVNLHQCMFLTHYALPYLKQDDAANKYGKKIVFISSVAGLIGSPSRTVYGATKSAVLRFAEALRCELSMRGRDHVGVTSICPGPVQTDINRTRIHMGGGAPRDIPFPKGTLTAEAASQKIQEAMRADLRLVSWMPATNVMGILRPLCPNVAERLVIRSAKALLDT
jgi:short-subunit dehydrogenase